MMKNKSKRKSSGSSDRSRSSHLEHKPENTTHPSDQAKISKPDTGPATLSGTLYIIATPIGNASDISLRALDMLRTVHVLACEDTRVTSKLLARHGISVPLMAYHEHNGEKARPAIIRRLKNGENVALVSDAGTPLISDPGYKLVRACAQENLPVTTLPGASAVMSALVLSGLPTNRFMFAGFLPPKRGQRRHELEALAIIPATLVFMESPRRLPACLMDMCDVLGDRDAAVSREITKLYEETRRGSLTDLADIYDQEGPPKGEVMIVVSGPQKVEIVDDEALEGLLRAALQRTSLRDAVKEVALVTRLPRQKVYQQALFIDRDLEKNGKG
jgi:16S rRNA (cytidine1402-2'-O)-methyltransferase